MSLIKSVLLSYPVFSFVESPACIRDSSSTTKKAPRNGVLCRIRYSPHGEDTLTCHRLASGRCSSWGM